MPRVDRLRRRRTRPCQRAIRDCLRALLAVWAVVMATAPAPAAERLRLQGSTTFYNLLLESYQGRIEQRAGVKLDVIANKSIWGVVALLEGRADVAMISAGLPGEIMALKRHAPGLATDRLRAFEIVRSRVAFAIHPSNPVRHLALADIGRILSGEVVNWQAFGGPDLPIRLVVVREGGGTVVAVRSQTIGNARLAAPNLVRLESARHVLAVVGQEPGAIGIAQLGLLKKAGLPEIATDQPVEQRLSIVTLGDPGPAIVRLIDAARIVAVEHLM